MAAHYLSFLEDGRLGLVSLNGFATLVREGLTVTVGQRVNLTVSMQLSAVQERIVVTAESSLIETSQTAGVTEIGRAAI